ncbi:hypothetical protein BKA57DRAFT_256940 [Linnemannia elongata]|nr:hypothetical protein BKA57DRAFT_256940 [Linnemannia elongata]
MFKKEYVPVTPPGDQPIPARVVSPALVPAPPLAAVSSAQGSPVNSNNNNNNNSNNLGLDRSSSSLETITIKAHVSNSIYNFSINSCKPSISPPLRNSIHLTSSSNTITNYNNPNNSSSRHPNSTVKGLLLNTQSRCCLSPFVVGLWRRLRLHCLMPYNSSNKPLLPMLPSLLKITTTPATRLLSTPTKVAIKLPCRAISTPTPLTTTMYREV